MNSCKILCFGDSITFGYAPMFERRFKKAFPDIDATMINAGVCGETSRDGLQRLACLFDEQPEVVLIGFGMNDQRKGVSTVELVSNLSQMVSGFEGIGARVLLLTINPVSGAPGNSGNARIDAYNQVIKDAAHEKRVRIVDVNSVWKREIKPWHKGLIDSFHPNELGYEVFCKALLRVVLRRSIIILWQYNGNPCECNYACPYCTYDPRTQKGHYFKGTIEVWRQAFKSAFGNQHLVFYLAHGEPMIGEKFYDVLDMIGDEQNWEVRMTSNISVPLDRLAKTQVAIEGRLNINASFHPKMTTINDFLKQALFLRDHGIEVPIIYVMWPPFLKRFEQDFEVFSKHRFLVYVFRFQGVFKGKQYPQAYTEGERQFMCRYMDDAMIKYILHLEPSFGKLTWSGVDFMIMDNEGDVGYTDALTAYEYCLGNIFKGTLRLLTEPQSFPGRSVSEHTVDGVANFLELNYRQLDGNNVIAFARQGGVYHTPDGVFYKNMYTDFNDPCRRAEYRFPPRNILDCYYILRSCERSFDSRVKQVSQFLVPEAVISRFSGLHLHASLANWLGRAISLVRRIVINISIILRSLLGLLYGSVHGLPGIRMHLFGWRCALYFLYAKDWRCFRSMLMNPVSLFRYPEFDFALRAVNWEGVGRVLDVSSPRLLSAYLLAHNSELQMQIINPDRRDVGETRSFLEKCCLNTANLTISCLYAADIPYEPGSFDVVYSISVVEHVLDEEERNFLLKLWSLVKPGGTLLLTVPVAAKHRNEYRQEDTYGLGYPRNSKREVFFQRCYDAYSLKQRVFDVLEKMPRSMEVFGTAKGWKFGEYVQRCMTYGLRETSKDVYYVSKYIKKVDLIDLLHERGICCMSFFKEFEATDDVSEQVFQDAL